jgi:hypothetical protein
MDGRLRRNSEDRGIPPASQSIRIQADPPDHAIRRRPAVQHRDRGGFTVNRSLALVPLAVLAALLAVIAVPLQVPELGLDPSWQQALVEATDRGWIFGREIVFTYGPLHQLATAQASSNLLPLLLGRLISGAAWGSAVVLIGLFGGTATAVALVLWIAIVPTEIPSGPDALHLQLCSLGVLVAMAASRWRDLSSTRRRTRRLVSSLLTLQMIGIAIGALVKLSYLGASIPALLAISWIQLNSTSHNSWRAWWRALSIISLPILTIVLTWMTLASTDLSSLGNYFTGLNLEVVRGYSEAMSSTKADTKAALVYVLACALTALLLQLWFIHTNPQGSSQLSSAPERSNRLVANLALACIGFVSFKASFVRDDELHMMIGRFWLLGVLIVLSTWIFSRNQAGRSSVVPHARRILIATLLAFAASVWLLELKLRFNPEFAQEAWLFPQRLWRTEQRRQSALKRQQTLEKLRGEAEDLRIPAGASADSLTTEISAILSQYIRYQPRPILQSYSAYSPRLQQANANHFASAHRPEFVVVNLSEIDDRLPVSLDSPALRQILRHYSLSHRGNLGSLVFRSRPDHRDANLTQRQQPPLASGTLRWTRQRPHWRYQSDLLEIPDTSGAIHFSGHFENNPQRSLLTAVYRPQAVWIELLNHSGVPLERHRFIPSSNLQILIWPLIRNNDDLARALASDRGKHSLGISAPDQTFTAIRFVTDSLGPPFRRSHFRLDR